MGRTAKPLLRKLNEEEEQTISEVLLHNSGLVIKKYKNHAVMWCGQCNTEERISLDLAKQVEKSRLCPFCYQKVELHKQEWKYENEMLVKIGDAGYYFNIRKKVGQKPKIYHKQVAYWADAFYARNVMMNMYRWCFRKDKYWRRFYGSDAKKWTSFRKRRTKSFNSLDMQFYTYEYLNDGFYDVRSKREYLEGLYLPEVKSNLKKIFIDNHLNREQILAAIIFDLKSVKDIYKYNAYICKQPFMELTSLNIHHLDYLYRNKIRYHDFVDYLDQCKTLNIKPTKPKDFYKIHNELTIEIKVLNEAKRNEEIRAVAEELMRKSYAGKNIKIKPLMDVRDIVETGAELHNCIKTYIGKYAEGKTELYVLRDKGERMVAIEVTNGELIQARADFNRDPLPKYKRIITKWMKEAYV